MSKILLVYEDFSETMLVESTLKKVGFDVVSIGSEALLSQQIVSFNPDAVIAHGRSSKVSTISVGKKLKDMLRWNGKVVLIFYSSAKPLAEDLIKMRMDTILESPVSLEKLIQVLARVLNLFEPHYLEKLKLMQAQGESSQESSRSHVSETADEKIVVKGGAQSQSGADQQNVKNFNISDSPKEVGRKSFNIVQEEEDLLSSTDIQPVKEAQQSDSPVVPEAQAVDEELLRLKQELVEAAQTDSKRISKYKKFIKNTTVQAKSTVTRKEARRVQQELMTGIVEAELENQDELRREFTRALFKKKV